MLRPERMSKVSISGAKSVMEETIAVLHELELVHLEEYDDSWESFRTGDPLGSAEAASEWLVTIRALENSLGIDRDEVPPADVPDLEEAADRLEAIRTRVNELEDDRANVTDELRALREEFERLAPLARLGIDLDLLQGYGSIDVAVGEGSPAAVRSALADSEAIEAFEVFANEGVVAIAARADAGAVSDALVGVDFTALEVPDGSGDPTKRRDEIEQEITRLEHEREQTEASLEEAALEHGGFLVALERDLSVQVDRAEAPLKFATTAHSFIAEGWVPTRRVDRLSAALERNVGERVEVDELERMDYEPPHERAHADGGRPEMHGAHPPVIQRNPALAKPFEVFVETVNRPKYHELDPTIIIFLTFPAAFGYMIGDIGYGLLYMALGWGMLKVTDSKGAWALGVIGIWAGLFTVMFGYFYDDFFGIHMHDLGIHLPLAGTLSKGLQVQATAQLWVVLSILFGVVHLSVGYLIGLINDRHHGLYHAFTENGAWLLVLWGLFIWIFSNQDAGAYAGPESVADTDFAQTGIKPDFIVGTDSVLYENPMFDFGFAGFPEPVAIVALGMILVGAVFVYAGEGFVAIIEIPTNAFGHALSYIRLMAVLLAKGGMAFVVNLIVFGAYSDQQTVGGEEVSYVVFDMPTVDVGADYTQEFAGLIHIEPVWLTIPVAVLVFVAGHVIVLLLGITAAGIQMTRLEYVEFFGKFYEGGGARFEPFGYKNAPTEEH